jgi:hypothetical protein
MKRYLIIGAIAGAVAVLALVAILAVGVVSYRVALAQTQPDPTSPNNGYGPGMMGRWGGSSGMMGRGGGFGRGMMGFGDGTTGPMHDYMINALAEKLGLEVTELQAEIDAGKTPYEVAQAQGLSEEEIRQVWLEAHDQALEQAVAAGTLTQEQADWMDSRMEQKWQNGFVPGSGPCHGGVGGRWNGQ